MNKKGQGFAIFIAVILIALVGLVGYMVFRGPSQQVVQQQSAQIAEEIASGDVASLGIYVRDLAQDNENTKIAVPVYCVDSTGAFILDGTSSSTSAETTAKTTIGETVTCYAFNSTIQSNPKTITISNEAPHIMIDAYSVATSYGHLQYYDDTYTTGTAGLVNVTVAGDGTSTFAKLRYTQNMSDKFLPLGGFYLDTVVGSNITEIDMSGSATLSGMDHSSARVVTSTLATRVSDRKEKWDYVFELDDSSEAGNQVLLMDEHDYLETGAVSVTGDSDGCSTLGEEIVSYAFTKGYYRSSTDGVKYGHETDASSN